MLYLANVKLPTFNNSEFSRFSITSLTVVLILLLFIGKYNHRINVSFRFLILRLNSPHIHPDLETKGPPGNVIGCIYFES